MIWAISYNTKLCVMINIQTTQKQIDENTDSNERDFDVLYGESSSVIV